MNYLNWITEIKRRGAVLGMHYLCYGMNKYVPYLFGVPFIYRNVLYLNSCLRKVKEEDDNLKFLLKEAFESDYDYFLTIAKLIRAESKAIVSFVQRFLNQEAVSNTEQKNLPMLFESYISVMSHFGTYFRFMEPSMVTLENLMIDVLRNKVLNPSDIQEKLLCLCVSGEHDYVTAERRSLLAVAAEADYKLGRDARRNLSAESYVEQLKNDEEIWEKLIYHAQSYGWMGTADHLGSPYTAEHYGVNIHSLEIDDIEAMLIHLKEGDEQQIKKAQNLVEELSLSPRELKIVQSFQEYEYINALIKEIVLSSQQKAEYLLARISRILDVDRDTLIALTFNEILSYLRDGSKLDSNIRKVANERKEDWAMLVSDSEITIYSGSELADFKAQFQEPKYNHLTEVKGAPANLGKVTSIVKVIHDVEEFVKIQRGDIVVTSMTTPEYSAVMDKISGIITDEGGVTSHAGSIARERGIPCLVGTKIATQVFKDGDKIDLDAIRGVASKIKEG